MIEITRTRLTDGVWQGDLVGVPDTAVVTVSIRGNVLDDFDAEAADDDALRLSVRIPSKHISEGVNTFVISSDDAPVGNFTLIAGDLAGDDLRAEVDLLREELDLLKKAFRSHVRETI